MTARIWQKSNGFQWQHKWRYLSEHSEQGGVTTRNAKQLLLLMELINVVLESSNGSPDTLSRCKYASMRKEMLPSDDHMPVLPIDGAVEADPSLRYFRSHSQIPMASERWLGSSSVENPESKKERQREEKEKRKRREREEKEKRKRKGEDKEEEETEKKEEELLENTKKSLLQEVLSQAKESE
eukprot:Skav219297  [mRNA]  locus=scaffold2157:473469:474505:- [translate_table: standard]